MPDRQALTRFALRIVVIFFVLAAVTAIAGILVRAWSPGFDLQAMQAVADHRTALGTQIASIVSDAGSFAILAPLTIALVLLRRWRRPADDLALIVVAAGSAALPSVVKLIVARPRPTIEHLTHLTSLSFPSEHTTQAAAIYLAIASLLTQGRQALWRRLALALAVVIAILVALSRVFLGVHYPTDVGAGLLLGWLWTIGIFRYARSELKGPGKPEIVQAAPKS
ncbi:MAG TPA: phosphatase PAP2 family protein [Candidatus Dormibacteraeota bacterium]|jgi:undecaprenyl-diphosphatase